MDSVLLALRVILSLAVVLGLMWGLSRVARGRQSVRGLPIEVVARTSMGRHSSVVIVNVQGRGLVLGVTEHTMTMLAEVELEPEPAAFERRETLDLSRELPESYSVPALTAARMPTTTLPATTLPATTLPVTTVPANGLTATALSAVHVAPATVPATSQPVAVVTALPEPVGRREATTATPSTSPLEGSILSPATWRSMATALRERSVRA